MLKNVKMQKNVINRGRLLVLKIILPFFLVSAVNGQENIWQELESQFDSNESFTPVKCGFPVLMEIYGSGDELKINLLNNYFKSIKQKKMNTYLSPSGHFLINYDPSEIPIYDRDGNGTPDYLEFVAKSFDLAWLVEIDSLKFKQPLDQNGVPLETYQIFCTPLGSRTYGITDFTDQPDISSLVGWNFASSIYINTNFSFVQYPSITSDPIVRDSLAIAVTAAHEFNHALQLSYRIWFEDDVKGQGDFVDLWYIENSATYMEEVVADEVNDYYQYLPSFFAATDEGLTSAGNHIYGEVILNIMLGQLYGKTISREIWEEIVNQPALPALNKVLQRKGSDIEREIYRLAEWMFFSGDKYSVSGEFFPEAENYPAPQFHTSDEFNSGFQKIGGSELPPFSFQYLKTAISTDNNLNIYLVPENTHSAWWGAYFSFFSPFSHGFPAKVYSQIPYQSIQANSDTLFTAVIAGNGDDGNMGSMIGYSLFLREYSGNLETGILVYPSIIKPEQEINYITFNNVPADARIEIFSGSGMRISTIRPQFSKNSVFWNLKTSQGDFVGSGVYIYSIVSSTISQRGKIIVIR